METDDLFVCLFFSKEKKSLALCTREKRMDRQSKGINKRRRIVMCEHKEADRLTVSAGRPEKMDELKERRKRFFLFPSNL